MNAFPGDDSGDLRPRQTPGMLYSLAPPTPVRAPGLLAWSDDLALQLGIDAPAGAGDVALLAGNALAPGMKPYAACYGGHQFGHWAGQLGDGRAITLGEWPAEDGSMHELQLKGGGITPYSRTADGRAVLRSSLREYLLSEAMHHLGIPTTRALSLVSTGEKVVRDMFYDGHPAPEQGAIVMRVAPSFLRFGNFELLYARKDYALLGQLADWTIARFFPDITGEDRVVRWMEEVIRRTARLMAEWMRVGFVHGVMNTDNMSVLGLTIDYGPFSFMDAYDPQFTPNTTDLPGRRYAFGRQPGVARWNLACLAGALSPLVPDAGALADAVNTYDDIFAAEYGAMMARKTGLGAYRQEDADLLSGFHRLLLTLQADHTIFYIRLTELDPAADPGDDPEHFAPSLYGALSEEGKALLGKTLTLWRQRVLDSAWNDAARQAMMEAANPRFIPRNYQLFEAIEALEKGDTSPFEALRQAILQPYSKQYDHLSTRPPAWAAETAGCSMLSCSS